ncbi:MAG: lmo0937 family membrane protein [Tepidiformaceae bacterium]
MSSLLWMITLVLVVLWVLGFAVNLGAWIWFLLILAVVTLLINLISRGRANL